MSNRSLRRSRVPGPGNLLLPRGPGNQARGIPFTFTPEEEHNLAALSDRIAVNLRRKQIGYRLMVVQDTTEMHQIIHGALKRRRQEFDGDSHASLVNGG